MWRESLNTLDEQQRRVLKVSGGYDTAVDLLFQLPGHLKSIYYFFLLGITLGFDA